MEYNIAYVWPKVILSFVVESGQQISQGISPQL